ncbi:hypothetical protein DAPPUDRAFT_237855 [Daphnia pulex]|uniref:Uncharacterized protein n=1 Tax=Daphnia pulex TaxID=6669 RepID=E9G4K9_DAPPU|nr:hypothetical protein DAPPUDRAFT_237855 [Daphnia pulex]|eukprot:EFX85538.1 hypothetical protein DAPPUDRAFT_237855 [Daphnia pulex]
MTVATYGHSDEHDDYSDEVRSILAPPTAQNNVNVPANNNGGRITANIPGSVYRLRSNRPASLPWREGEDDVQVQIDPVTKQVVNIRTELRDSLEHDVDFSDAITSRIVVSPTLVVSPVNTNGNVQPTPLNGRLLSLHSDELYDDSYEVKVNLNRPNGQNLTGPVHFISRHSDEHDDSLEMVRGIPSAGQVRSVLPVQTAVNGERFIVGNDEVDDFSLEDYHDAVRSGRTQLPIASAGGFPTVTTGVEHLLRHSDEHDSSSIELIRSLGNLPGIAQSPMVQQQGVQGVQLIQKHSSELDDTSVEVVLVRNQTGSGLHLISQNSDEHDISLEVVRPVLNPQTGQNPAAVTPVQGLQSKSIYCAWQANFIISKAIYCAWQANFIISKAIYCAWQANFIISKAIYCAWQANFIISKAIYCAWQANFIHLQSHLLSLAGEFHSFPFFLQPHQPQNASP